MNETQLRQTFAIANGQLSVAADDLVGAVARYWKQAHPQNPLVIRDAAPGPDDGVDGAVVIHGRAPLLKIPDLPVVARIWLEGGELRMRLRYQLRDSMPAENAWVFSRSFPSMPKVWDHGSVLGTEPDAAAVLAAQRPYVDSLLLFDTALFLTSHADTDPELGVALEAGLNLASRLRPQGALGIVEAIAGEQQPLLISGPIRVPLDTDGTTALVRFERPWEREDAPGVHLRAELGLGFELGAMAFEDAALRIYTPHDQAWLDQNPSYQPRMAYVGTLRIPSADLSLDLDADMEWNASQLGLRARCEGVSVGKLAALADFSGGLDLDALLPDQLQPLIAGLERLELTELWLTMGVADGKASINHAAVTVGMPSLEWKIWGDELVLRRPWCLFSITQPTAAPKLALTVGGELEIAGVALKVAAGGDPFTFYASLAEGERIPLSALFASLAPGVGAPADLDVDRLDLGLSLGTQLSLGMELASKTPWTIRVGKAEVALSNLSLDLSWQSGAAVTGTYAGAASIGKDLALSMKGTLAGDLTLRGTFTDLSLSGLVHRFCDQLAPTPAGFDLDIASTCVLVSKRGAAYSLSAAAELAGVGTLAFEVRSGATGSGFAAGLSLTTATLAKLQGLSALAALENFVELRSLLLVQSSFDDPNFAFPDMAQFAAPALASKQVRLPGTGGVMTGFNVFAEWALDLKAREQKLLAALLGLNATQQITLQIGSDPKNARLYLDRRGKLQGKDFDYQLGVVLSDGKPGFFLTGSLSLAINKQPQRFDLTTVFVPGGAFLSANMSGQTAVDCGPFQLSNLGLAIGVNWAGVPSLGVTASIAVERFHSSVAVFFDSTDPSKSLVAGSISDLTLADVTATLLGGQHSSPIDGVLGKFAVRGTGEFIIAAGLAKDLENLEFESVARAFASQGGITIPTGPEQLTLTILQAGEVWHLTDLVTMRHYQLRRKDAKRIKVTIAPQLYFAPQATAIGTARFPQGYYINAALVFLGFELATTIEISVNKGIAVDAGMDPIHFGNSELFHIGATEGKGGPRLSLATFSRPKHPEPLLRQPHAYVDGELTLLGVTQAIHASVTTSGIECILEGPLAPACKFDVDARFGKAGFAAAGQIDVDIGSIDLGALGKVKLDSCACCQVDIDIDGKGMSVRVEADFEVAGEDFEVAEFELPLGPKALADLANTMGKKIEAVLRDVYKDSTRWLYSMEKGAISGVESSDDVLKNVYKQSGAKKAVESTTKSVTKKAKKKKKKLKKAF